MNLQTVLQDTEESSRKIESGLDRLIEEDETAVLVSFLLRTLTTLLSDRNCAL